MLSKSVMTLCVFVFATFFVASNAGQLPVEQITYKAVDQKYIQCVATAIYYEAKNEPTLGQVAVAKVVMNRVVHNFAKNPCEVVYQKTITRDSLGNITGTLCQFSWTCEGKTMPSLRNKKFAEAYEIAQDVMSTDKWDKVLPDNVLFFHARHVNPRWIYRKVATIGNHVFYSKGKEKKVIQKD